MKVIKLFLFKVIHFKPCLKKFITFNKNSSKNSSFVSILSDNSKIPDFIILFYLSRKGPLMIRIFGFICLICSIKVANYG